MQTIGEKIKKLRKQKGVSQEETAFELGVTRQTVSKWESGAMQPNAESIRMLSDYFAVSPVYFFGGEQAVAETEISQAVTEPAHAPAFALAPAKDKKRAFIICLFLLIVSVIVFTLFMLGAIGYGVSYFTTNRGYYTVINPEVKPIFISCLIGSIISFGAITGLVVALINLRK